MGCEETTGVADALAPQAGSVEDRSKAKTADAVEMRIRTSLKFMGITVPSVILKFHNVVNAKRVFRPGKQKIKEVLG